MATINVPRRAIYEKVWSAPLKQVAEYYDCDYWHLRNACVDRNIPTPPKGYWMKVAHGKPLPPRQPLPDHHLGYNSVILRTGLKEKEQRIEARRERAKLIGDITVPDRLRNMHPAVADLMRDRKMWSSNPQLNDILSAPPSECVKRGYRIANALAWAAQNRGFKVATTEDNLSLTIGSEFRTTDVRVREQLRQVRTLRKGAKAHKPGESIQGRYSFSLEQTGLLEIQIYRAKWAAEPKDDLVALLPRLISRLEVYREDDAAASAAETERAHQREIAAKERALQAEREKREAAAFAEFLSMSRRHFDAQEALNFLEKLGKEPTEGEAQQLIHWLREKITTYDPISNGPTGALHVISSIKGSRER